MKRTEAIEALEKISADGSGLLYAEDARAILSLFEHEKRRVGFEVARYKVLWQEAKQEAARQTAAAEAMRQRERQLIDQKASVESQLQAARRTGTIIAERAAVLLARIWTAWTQAADSESWMALMDEIESELDVRRKK